MGKYKKKQTKPSTRVYGMERKNNDIEFKTATNDNLQLVVVEKSSTK